MNISEAIDKLTKIRAEHGPGVVITVIDKLGFEVDAKKMEFVEAAQSTGWASVEVAYRDRVVIYQ